MKRRSCNSSVEHLPTGGKKGSLGPYYKKVNIWTYSGLPSNQLILSLVKGKWYEIDLELPLKRGKYQMKILTYNEFVEFNQWFVSSNGNPRLNNIIPLMRHVN